MGKVPWETYNLTLKSATETYVDTKEVTKTLKKLASKTFED